MCSFGGVFEDTAPVFESRSLVIELSCVVVCVHEGECGFVAVVEDDAVEELVEVAVLESGGALGAVVVEENESLLVGGEERVGGDAVAVREACVVEFGDFGACDAEEVLLFCECGFGEELVERLAVDGLGDEDVGGVEAGGCSCGQEGLGREDIGVVHLKGNVECVHGA